MIPLLLASALVVQQTPAPPAPSGFPGLAVGHVPQLGSTVESRQMRLYTIYNPATGFEVDKPAMWIDGNVHGNEVQGGEAVVYTAWYLLENYATNERVRKLVDENVFYLLPMVNPDGRWHWFHDAHNASSSVLGPRPPVLVVVPSPVQSVLDGVWSLRTNTPNKR